jgi:hypothetical protein
MKKILLILSILITTNLKAQEKHDIRNVNWGWTLAQVKVSEKLKLFEQTKNELTYFGSLNNKSFMLSYDFIDNKFVRLTYTCTEEFINKNNYIDQFNELKDILIKRYGSTSYDRVKWSDNLYKDRPQDIGLACSVGHVKFITQWFTDNTQINLQCNGENFKVNLGIIYTSVKYQPLIDAQEEKQNEKDF